MYNLFRMVAKRGSGSDEFSYCICAGANKNPEGVVNPLVCKTCEKKNHRSCTGYKGEDRDFECALCKVLLLDPFNTVVDFLWYGVMGNMETIFEIKSRDIEKCKTKNLEIDVISIPISKSKFTHEWPKTFEIRVDHEVIHVVKEPNWERKRRDNPARITYALTPNKVPMHVVEFVSTTFEEFGPLFLIVVMMVRPNTIDRIVDSIKRKRSVSYEDGLKRVLKIVNNIGDADDDVMCLETRHKMVLNCPVTLDRITLPARGRHCGHIQCYDLEGYLQVMQNTANFNVRWKCPECHLVVKPFDLVIDGYVKKILDETPKDVTTVELEKSGKYRVLASSAHGKGVADGQISAPTSTGSYETLSNAKTSSSPNSNSGKYENRNVMVEAQTSVDIPLNDKNKGKKHAVESETLQDLSQITRECKSPKGGNDDIEIVVIEDSDVEIIDAKASNIIKRQFKITPSNFDTQGIEPSQVAPVRPIKIDPGNTKKRISMPNLQSPLVPQTTLNETRVKTMPPASTANTIPSAPSTPQPTIPLPISTQLSQGTPVQAPQTREPVTQTRAVIQRTKPLLHATQSLPSYSTSTVTRPFQRIPTTEARLQRASCVGTGTTGTGDDGGGGSGMIRLARKRSRFGSKPQTFCVAAKKTYSHPFLK